MYTHVLTSPSFFFRPYEEKSENLRSICDQELETIAGGVQRYQFRLFLFGKEFKFEHDINYDEDINRNIDLRVNFYKWCKKFDDRHRIILEDTAFKYNVPVEHQELKYLIKIDEKQTIGAQYKSLAKLTQWWYGLSDEAIQINPKYQNKDS